MKVDFYRHGLNEDDINRACDVLRSLFLTTGSVTAEFEQKYADYSGLKRVVGLTSCTSALQLALLAWGIGPGDEVITTPMTFCATSNTVMHVGATPVFCDVEPGSGNLDASGIEKKITPNTKAIMPVHLYGQMCDMKAIREIADRHGLVVVEDSAHCVEGEREGIRPGQLADAACFSFYATKNLTSGEGGAIGTNNEEKAELLLKLRMHGMDKSAADRYSKKYQHYDVTVLGWKANMDNLKAALLIGQMDRLETLLARREEISRAYSNAFRDLPGVDLIEDLSGVKHARHVYTVLAPEGKRDRMLGLLQDKNVGVAVNYRAVHLMDLYRKSFGLKEGDFPVAESIGDRTLTLPLYPGLKDEEVEYVMKSVREAVEEL